MFEAAVIGVSAGGMQALKVVLSALPAGFPLPIAIVQHIAAQSDAYFVDYLDDLCVIKVKEAEDKEDMRPSTAYLAPPDYHLLIEQDRSFTLSMDDKVHYCRPAIDPLFQSAADAFGAGLIGIILTGANADGAHGLCAVKARGGRAIVQNPQTAEVPYMPKAALEATAADHTLDLEKIAPLLIKLSERRQHNGTGTHG